MGIHEKAVAGVTPADVHALVADRVPESRTLEYKAQLHGTSPRDKHELLADVSAIANTAGGTVVFGIATRKHGDNAVAERIVGIDPTVDVDAEILRLSATLRTGLTPPFTQLQWHRVTTTAGLVLLLRVSRSIRGPHMLTFDNAREFWRRGPADKYQPDVQELRSMFLEGVTWLDEVEQFRRRRADTVRAGGRGNPNFDTRSSVFVHVLPAGRLDRVVNLREHESALRSFGPLTQGLVGWNQRFNSVGFQTYTDTITYAQWFRHGGVEGYSAFYRGETADHADAHSDLVYVERLTAEARAFARRGLQVLQDVFGIGPPFVVGVAAYGFAGALIAVPPHLARFTTHAIDADVELLPPILIEEADAPNLDGDLDEVIDIIWQSAGWAGRPRQPPVE